MTVNFTYKYPFKLPLVSRLSPLLALWKLVIKAELGETISPVEEDLTMDHLQHALSHCDLGETISPMEEDLTMDHLQDALSHCYLGETISPMEEDLTMDSGNCWKCKQCENFPRCDKCYETVKKFEDRERHPINQKEKHTLDQSEIKDNDVRNACYQKYGASLAECDAQNKEAREHRVQQLKKMLDLLVHASQCRFLHCPYPNCRKVKGLFRHGMRCEIRAAGGCVLCKKMWYILQLHAHACKASECHVPRCRDLKEHQQREQQQEAYSRRRAALMEKIWQPATSGSR